MSRMLINRNVWLLRDLRTNASFFPFFFQWAIAVIRHQKFSSLWLYMASLKSLLLESSGREIINLTGNRMEKSTFSRSIVGKIPRERCILALRDYRYLIKM